MRWLLSKPLRLVRIPALLESFNLNQMPEIVVYTGRLCPYCTMAKRLLERKGASYTEIDVDSRPGLRQELMEKTQRRTIPQIFIGERHIGGFDDLQALDMRNALDPLLREQP